MPDPFDGMVVTRETPARKAVLLTAAMLSDTTDLDTPAKALRVSNTSAAAVTLRVTLAGDAAGSFVPVTIPAGIAGYELLSVSRIWSAGSTGLAAALSAGTVEVLLLTL